MQEQKKETPVLTKQMISKEFAKRMDLAEFYAERAVQTFIDILTDQLASGGRIELRRFGVFKPKLRKELTGRNPLKPKDPIVIPAHYVVKFTPGSEVLQRLNGRAAKDQEDSKEA